MHNNWREVWVYRRSLYHCLALSCYCFLPTILLTTLDLPSLTTTPLYTNPTIEQGHCLETCRDPTQACLTTSASLH